MTVGNEGIAEYQLVVAQQLSIGSGGRLVVGAASGSSGSIYQDHVDSIVQVGSDGGDLILLGSQILRYRRLGYPGPRPPEQDQTRRLGGLAPAADSV